MADPVLMVVGLAGVLAVGQRVPELDFVVGAGGDDLSVVGGEGHGENFLLVSDELADGLSGSEVPESESLVPGGGDTEESVVGEGDVRDEVVVSGEGFVGHSVDAVLAFLVQVPDHDRLVPGSRHQKSLVNSFLLHTGRLKGCDPVVMSG